MIILSRIDLFLNKIYFYLITILGLLLVFVVFYGVIQRYVFNTPLIWGYELSILLFMWVAFFGMTMGFKENRLRSITFIIDKIKNEQIKKRIEIFLSVLITLILLTCTVAGFLVFLQMCSITFRTINLSLGWQYLPLPISFAAMSFTSIDNLFELIRK
jgi:TRAP-type C4-dicarboxylate transport system permease small subunit